MLSGDLPGLAEVKAKYDIAFERYAVFTYHPVTTELPRLEAEHRRRALAPGGLGQNFVVIYPNNDAGADVILASLERTRGQSRASG